MSKLVPYMRNLDGKIECIVRNVQASYGIPAEKERWIRYSSLAIDGVEREEGMGRP
jgi:hypothetical protein